MTLKEGSSNGKKMVLKKSNEARVMSRLAFTFLLLMLFAGCQTTLSDKEIAAYKEKGALISKGAGKELSAALTGKMKSGGIAEAIEFCNTAALPLTQQMSDKHKVHIKRTSLKTRNPLNKPSDNEILVLRDFQTDLDRGISLEPKVKLDQNGIPNYYAPILIEAKCLVCHGTMNKELSRPVDSIIKSYYPNDMATGYDEGDLRGIWSIAFSKPNS